MKLSGLDDSVDLGNSIGGGNSGGNGGTSGVGVGNGGVSNGSISLWNGYELINRQISTDNTTTTTATLTATTTVTIFTSQPANVTDIHKHINHIEVAHVARYHTAHGVGNCGY